MLASSRSIGRRCVVLANNASPLRTRLSGSCVRQDRRTVTNATKPDHVPALLSVPRVAEKAGGWHPTLIHSSGDTKWTVIRLKPGHGEVPKHFHNTVSDYFIALEGEAVIETRTKDGVEKDFKMQKGSFLWVGPGDEHRVLNVSDTEEFVFLIAQTPRHSYDFVPTGDIDPKWTG